MDRNDVVARLAEGAQVWNRWRDERPADGPLDLTGLDLRQLRLVDYNFQDVILRNAVMTGCDMRHVILKGANLSHADLRWARLYKADFTGAILDDAKAQGADFRRAEMRGVKLRRAHLRDATFREAMMSEAELHEADLTNAVFVQTDLRKAQLIRCRVYGCAAWRPDLEGATQAGLIVTPLGEPDILVDDVEVAQFLHLLLHNEKLRNVLDTVTSRAVLVLGRFTPDRKAVLERLSEAFRTAGYVPILFDFEPSCRRDLTETIQILAGLVMFVVADLTEAKSVPQELSHIVPNLPSVPVLPILAKGFDAYAMFEHWRQYRNILEVRRYAPEEFDGRALALEIVGDVVAWKQRPSDVRALEADLQRERSARAQADDKLAELQKEIARLRASRGG